jgi:hypothetical protein
MLPENVAGLFMLVFLASIAAIALAHTDFCTFCDRLQPEKAGPSDDEGNLQEELTKLVAQLQQDQAANNARFEKAMSIIQALQRQGERCECDLGHCTGIGKFFWTC